MKTFRSLLLYTGCILAFAIGSASAKPGWMTDYKQAQEEAKTNKKLLLVDFTGSDWCGWCIRLDREVFSRPEFKEYASKNLVLLEVDFPRGKALPPAQKAQNQELAQQHRIQGFPTIVVLDSDGKKIGELGYMPGGPAAFIAELDRLRKS
ncbi:MAG: thioredoxin family protein [Chthoniobacterales bacterium]